jgi:hypothetical protein
LPNLADTPRSVTPAPTRCNALPIERAAERIEAQDTHLSAPAVRAACTAPISTPSSPLSRAPGRPRPSWGVTGSCLVHLRRPYDVPASKRGHVAAGLRGGREPPSGSVAPRSARAGTGAKCHAGHVWAPGYSKCAHVAVLLVADGCRAIHIDLPEAPDSRDPRNDEALRRSATSDSFQQRARNATRNGPYRSSRLDSEPATGCNCVTRGGRTMPLTWALSERLTARGRFLVCRVSNLKLDG